MTALKREKNKDKDIAAVYANRSLGRSGRAARERHEIVKKKKKGRKERKRPSLSLLQCPLITTAVYTSRRYTAALITRRGSTPRHRRTKTAADKACTRASEKGTEKERSLRAREREM